MSKKIALIAGGGPAGLTAAYELLKAEGANIKPVVFEKQPKFFTTYCDIALYLFLWVNFMTYSG